MVPGLGIRCVDTNPWVTGAETCELVLALDTLGDRDRALRLLRDMQHLRDDDGAYWTGYVYPDEVDLAGRADDVHRRRRGARGRRPVGDDPGSDIFRGETLPRIPARSGSSAAAPQPTASPAPPRTRASTRIDPTVSAGTNAPPSTARSHTWYGAWPPSSGRSKTSWMTSAPPGSNQGAKPA